MDLLHRFQRNFQTYSKFVRSSEDKNPNKPSIADKIEVKPPIVENPPPPSYSQANVNTIPRVRVILSKMDKRFLVVRSI